MKWLRLVPLAIVAATGTAAGADRLSVGAEEALILEVGNIERQSRWSPTGLSGANARLVRGSGTLSGTSDNADVSLRFTTGRIEGTLGSFGAVDLFVGHAGGRADVEGRIGSEVVNLSIAPSRIAGPLGACTYSLTSTGGDYRGFAHCGPGTMPTSVRLQLPASLAREQMSAVGALLAATLVPGLGSISIPSSAVVTQLAWPSAARSPAAQRPQSSPGPLGLTIADSEQGPVIANVVAGGIAARAGLDEGMTIVRVGNEDVKTADQVRRALRIAPRGSDLVFEVIAPGTAPELRSFRSVKVP